MAITVRRVGACILCLEGELSSCVLGTEVTCRLCIPKHIVHRRHCARHSAPSVLGLGLSHVEYDGDICNSPQSTEEHPPDPCLGTLDSTVLHVCTSRVGENNFVIIVLVRSDLFAQYLHMYPSVSWPYFTGETTSQNTWSLFIVVSVVPAFQCIEQVSSQKGQEEWCFS